LGRSGDVRISKSGGMAAIVDRPHPKPNKGDERKVTMSERAGNKKGRLQKKNHKMAKNHKNNEASGGGRVVPQKEKKRSVGKNLWK